MIKIGEKIPNATLMQLEFTPKGFDGFNLGEHLKGKKVVLIGVPGAFSPTCTNHLGSFLEIADKVKAKGVDEIICIAVNDPLVLGTWEKSMNAKGKVTIVSDWNAAFTEAMGLGFTWPEVGLGTRSRRYSALVVDGVLKHIEVQEDPVACDITRADNFLKHL